MGRVWFDTSMSLAFYNKLTKEEEDQIMTLVHSCKLIKNSHSSTVKEYSNTSLTSHWKLGYKNEPLIRSVESPLLCIMHSPNGKFFVHSTNGVLHGFLGTKFC